MNPRPTIKALTPGTVTSNCFLLIVQEPVPHPFNMTTSSVILHPEIDQARSALVNTESLESISTCFGSAMAANQSGRESNLIAASVAPLNHKNIQPNPSCETNKLLALLLLSPNVFSACSSFSAKRDETIGTLNDDTFYHGTSPHHVIVSNSYVAWFQSKALLWLHQVTVNQPARAHFIHHYAHLSPQFKKVGNLTKEIDRASAKAQKSGGSKTNEMERIIKEQAIKCEEEGHWLTSKLVKLTSSNQVLEREVEAEVKYGPYSIPCMPLRCNLMRAVDCGWWELQQQLTKKDKRVKLLLPCLQQGIGL
ncbi:hypothetical protein PPACK8108_LOCUS7026 [Phakopsora pachyrhizi]|uniref:Uncharacterized protein n=1 Tax=Phakopsora pachyrhizi TaxID=170000 RepID=A0AAV0AU25_PHAPC|nr:hypothetical protein PPACK8108_LOCUS7026 [Phakopsora pachyrhizi]